MSVFGIHFDRHTVGNVLKNVSPAAALIPGVGLAGTAALSAVGDLARGKNIGQAAKGAVGNVAIGAGARGLAGKAGIFGQGGAPAVANAPAVAHGGLPLPNVPNLTSTVPAPGIFGSAPPSGGVLSGLTGKVGGAADWLEHHPNAAAGIFSSAGNLATSGSENRLRDAQTARLEQQIGEDDYTLGRKKAADTANQPLREALWGQIMAGLNSPVTPNPYGGR